MNQSKGNKSLNQLAWQRFKKNKLAMSSFLFVIALSLLSVLGYLFVLDKTPSSNQQILEISMLTPGSEVSFIKLKCTQDQKSTSSIQELFMGKKLDYQLIPFSSIKIKMK